MRSTRRWLTTALGVVLTAIMLFPLYWMINVSLTQPTELRKDPPNLFPVNPTFDGYARVLSDQLPYLFTSLMVGLGSVAVTLLLSAPAGYALANEGTDTRLIQDFLGHASIANAVRYTRLAPGRLAAVRVR